MSNFPKGGVSGSIENICNVLQMRKEKTKILEKNGIIYAQVMEEDQANEQQGQLYELEFA